MAKIICCDKCRSVNVKEIDKERRNEHTTKESGFWGMGGSYTTDYIKHYDLYKIYKCKDCGFEFSELEYSC